jgi:hypothetical protein
LTKKQFIDSPAWITACLLAAGGQPVKSIGALSGESNVIDELYLIAEDAPSEVNCYLLDYIFKKTGMVVEVTDDVEAEAETATRSGKRQESTISAL